MLISNVAIKTDTDDHEININVTLSNTTSECSVNCGNGTKTTTIVSCIGKKSAEVGKFRIDDSLKCTTIQIETECSRNSLDCPGTYNVIMEYKSKSNKYN